MRIYGKWNNKYVPFTDLYGLLFSARNQVYSGPGYEKIVTLYGSMGRSSINSRGWGYSDISYILKKGLLYVPIFFFVFRKTIFLA